jgi:hypothetical protein
MKKLDDNRTITELEELDGLRDTVADLQDEYRARGLYREFDNLPEQRASEESVYDQLLGLFPADSIDPGFQRISRYDLYIKLGRKEPYKIEVKTKIEPPLYYVSKWLGRQPNDRTCGIGEDKLTSQLLTCDYIVYTKASRSSTDFLASTSDIQGIVDCRLLSEKDFVPSIGQHGRFLYLPLLNGSHYSMPFTGPTALQDFARALQARDEAEQEGNTRQE